MKKIDQICETCGQQMYISDPFKNELHNEIATIYRVLENDKLISLFRKFVEEYNQQGHDTAMNSIKCIHCTMVTI